MLNMLQIDWKYGGGLYGTNSFVFNPKQTNPKQTKTISVDIYIPTYNGFHTTQLNETLNWPRDGDVEATVNLLYFPHCGLFCHSQQNNKVKQKTFNHSHLV